MRIISGSARGTNLFTLDGLTTRPTLDRVKESLFNIIQNEIPESVFLDLFSGSGAVGLESASRGARKTILCDKSKDAIKIINKNIEKTHLKEKVELYNVDYKELIKNKLKEKIDIVYIDPPYDSDFACFSSSGSFNLISLIKSKISSLSTIPFAENGRLLLLSITSSKDSNNVNISMVLPLSNFGFLLILRK